MFADLGAATLDADQLFHALLAHDPNLLRQIAQTFGAQYIGGDGSLDRRALGRLVFGDPEALRRLNAITHAPLLAEIERRLAQVPPTAKALVIEAAVLFEMGAQALCDVVVVTVARPETQARRLVDKGLTEQEAWQRVRAQTRDWRTNATYVIDTDVALRDVRSRVAAVWRQVVGEEG
jgi:dephospho-CoA kinase